MGRNVSQETSSTPEPPPPAEPPVEAERPRGAAGAEFLLVSKALAEHVLSTYTKKQNKQTHSSGQIISATSHDLGPKWWFRKGNGTPYFREI